jgi:uncharacterized protein
MERFFTQVIRFRVPVIVIFLGVTAFFASRVPQAELDTEVKSQLPRDMPSRLDLDRIEAVFSGTDMAMVVLQADDVLAPETLRRVKKISRKIERIGAVDRVLSLFTQKEIRAAVDEMRVDPAIQRIPKDDASREALRQRLKDNDLVYGNVVAKDWKAAAIVAFKSMEANDDELIASIEEAVASVPGEEPVVIGGMPFVRKQLGHDIQSDMRRFMPLGVIVLLGFLFLCFRQIRGVVLPFAVVVMSIAVGMGLVPLLGWKIQMVTIIMPVILIAVANDYGIHLMSAYQELNQPDTPLDQRALAARVAASLGLPIIATGVTTMAGLLCLMAHVIVPAEEMGVLASIAIAYALAASLLFLPAVLSFLPRSKPVIVASEGAEGGRLLERFLVWNARLVQRRPGRVVAVVLALVALASLGIGLVRVDTNPVNYYPGASPVTISMELINEHFGGANTVGVMVEGDTDGFIKGPKVMKAIDRFERVLEAHPMVGQTMSIARTVRMMNRVMNDDDPAFDVIPETREAIAQYFLLYSMSGEPEDFDRLVDFPYRHALLSARITRSSSIEIAEVVDFVRDYVEKEPGSPFKVVGGFAAVFTELVDVIVNGQIMSLTLSLLIIGLLLGLLFRSVVAGLISVLPLTLAMLLLFGLMGILRIELNIATAMLSSIMIGVGVDYTIHYLWRHRAERARGLTPSEAVFRTLTTTGRGIVFNALSVVVGFSLLLISSFLPIRFFGFLVVVSIAACLVGALMLLPALFLLWEPGFLKPRDTLSSQNQNRSAS